MLSLTSQYHAGVLLMSTLHIWLTLALADLCLAAATLVYVLRCRARSRRIARAARQWAERSAA